MNAHEDKAMRAIGFDRVGTGGGCEAFICEINESCVVYVTDGDLGAPSEDDSVFATVFIRRDGDEFMACEIGIEVDREYPNMSDFIREWPAYRYDLETDMRLR